MSKTIKRLLSIFMLVGVGVVVSFSQTNQLTLVGNGPTPVNGGTASVVGNGGAATYYYWIIAKFPIGNSVSFGPVIASSAPDVLTGSRYVQLNWPVAAGATGYDVVRGSSMVMPTTGNIAVILNTSSTTVNDTGGALSAYSVTSKGAVAGTLSMNASSFTTARFLFDTTVQVPTLCFSDATCLTTAAGGGIPVYTVATLPATCTVGQVAYVSDATVSGGGSYLYFCTTANTWGQFGYVAGGLGALTSNCTALPCTIEVTSSVPLKASANVFTGANTYASASKTAPFRIGASDPGTCDNTVREFFYNTTGNVLKVCNATNVWTAVGGGGGVIDANGYIMPIPGAVAGFLTNNMYAGESGMNKKGLALAFVPSIGGIVTKVGYEVTVSPGAGNGVTIGLYNSDGSTLLGSANTVNPSGYLTATISPSITLTAGNTYILVIAADSDLTMSGLPGNTSLLNGTGSGMQRWICQTTSTGSGAGLTLPSTCSKTGSTGGSYYGIPNVLLLP